MTKEVGKGNGERVHCWRKCDGGTVAMGRQMGEGEGEGESKSARDFK